MNKFLTLTWLIVCVWSAVDGDKIKPMPPGYGSDFNTSVYSGYLNTDSNDRKLHYVFVQSVKGANNTDPVTLWLNGGPGCSSMIGFLQQIGPYYLPDGVHYKVGDPLTKNPYSWNLAANLLFLESPAGVGFSFNHNSTSFKWNDQSTALDNINALVYFFSKYPEYRKNNFYIAGESYAGKYIPDLALRVDYYNRVVTDDLKINLGGMLIGNGVIDFQDGSLLKSQLEYLIDHQFIDPEILYYYTHSCQVDFQSAGCQYFLTKFNDNVDEINPYSNPYLISDVYDYCYYNDSFLQDGSKKQFLSQQSILMSLAKIKSQSQSINFNGAPCQYFDGMFEYFNAHKTEYNALPGLSWNGPCAENITGQYQISIRGSIFQLQSLLSMGYQAVFYNGDWDSVVPFTDTLKNLQKLKLTPNKLYEAFFVENQHAGWTQIYSGSIWAVIKGASHMVPQTKRAAALQLFQSVMKSKWNKKI